MTADQIPAAVVRGQLAKVLRSKVFAGRRSAARLLRFFVEESVRGGYQPISQLQIAKHALGLRDEFSPSKSAHVRVVMKRMRTALEAYYALLGKDDALIFRVTPGPYRLLVEPAPGQSVAAAAPGQPQPDVARMPRRGLPTLLMVEPAMLSDAEDDGRLGRDAALIAASSLVASTFVTAAGPLLRSSLDAEHSVPQVAASLGFDYVVDSAIRRLDDRRVRLTVDVAGTDGGGSILADEADMGPCADGHALAEEIAKWLFHRIGEAAEPMRAELGLDADPGPG